MTPDVKPEIPTGFLPLAKQILACLEKGQVASYSNQAEGYIQCYSLNSQGPCQPGEVLVTDTKLPFTRCISSQDAKGRPCPLHQFSYQGRCHNYLDDCGDCGERLQVDASGEVFCSCAADLGFVKWTDGRCYREATQGPCTQGHHLLKAPLSGQLACVAHGCPQNQTKWPTPGDEDDDLCYTVDCDDCNAAVELQATEERSLPSVKARSQLAEILSLRCIDENSNVRGANFGNCVKEAEDGTCLKRARSKESADIRKTMLKAIYNDIL